MKLTKLEKQMEEILYSDNGIPETWAGSEESIPKDKRIGKLLSLLETDRKKTLKGLVGAANSILKNKNADWRFNFDSYGNLVVQTLEQYETQTEGDKK